MIGLPELSLIALFTLAAANNPVNPCPTPVSALKARLLPALIYRATPKRYESPEPSRVVPIFDSPDHKIPEAPPKP